MNGSSSQELLKGPFSVHYRSILMLTHVLIAHDDGYDTEVLECNLIVMHRGSIYGYQYATLGGIGMRDFGMD